MSKYPTSFKADLRQSTGYSNIEESKWFEWSSRHLIELSALDTYHFVKGSIHRPRQRIVEVGCGNGYLTLELARDGHDVIGLDVSEEILDIARRTQAGSGTLDYICQDFQKWQAAASSFDIVIFNRTLHHISDLQQAMAKAKSILKTGGKVLCHDYAYDRFDDTASCWMYAVQRQLFLSGLYDQDPTTGADDAQSLEAVRSAWIERGVQHELRRYQEMFAALYTNFQAEFFAWIPYLFVYIINGIRNAELETERNLALFIKGMEKLQIEKGYIQAVGFRYIGRKV